MKEEKQNLDDGRKWRDLWRRKTNEEQIQQYGEPSTATMTIARRKRSLGDLARVEERKAQWVSTEEISKDKMKTANKIIVGRGERPAGDRDNIDKQGSQC